MGIDVVFAYDWPHRKLQDVLTRLALYGIPVKAIVAAPKVQLTIPTASVRTKLRSNDLIPPQELAALVNAEYLHAPHDSVIVRDFLQAMNPAVGLIAGARILKKRVIASFSKGIINLHPGLLPEVRGLDAMLWAIYDDQPQGVTGHLIDHRVDAGSIIKRQAIPLFPDDTILDISDRLREAEVALLPHVIQAAHEGKYTPVIQTNQARGKMPEDIERFTIDIAFPNYLKRVTKHAG
jgi:folate-dependent phosphoribosylglycinamide formyltransferase PurN